ncbi:hypothetical protein STEG23_010679, partial [Scotinomys teguina]
HLPRVGDFPQASDSVLSSCLTSDTSIQHFLPSGQDSTLIDVLVHILKGALERKDTHKRRLADPTHLPGLFIAQGESCGMPVQGGKKNGVYGNYSPPFKAMPVIQTLNTDPFLDASFSHSPPSPPTSQSQRLYLKAMAPPLTPPQSPNLSGNLDIRSSRVVGKNLKVTCVSWFEIREKDLPSMHPKRWSLMKPKNGAAHGKARVHLSITPYLCQPKLGLTYIAIRSNQIKVSHHHFGFHKVCLVVSSLFLHCNVELESGQGAKPYRPQHAMTYIRRTPAHRVELHKPPAWAFLFS